MVPKSYKDSSDLKGIPAKKLTDNPLHDVTESDELHALLQKKDSQNETFILTIRNRVMQQELCTSLDIQIAREARDGSTKLFCCLSSWLTQDQLYALLNIPNSHGWTAIQWETNGGGTFNDITCHLAWDQVSALLRVLATISPLAIRYFRNYGHPETLEWAHSTANNQMPIAQDRFGDTAPHYRAIDGRTEALHFLLHSLAVDQLTVATTDSLTATDCALPCGHTGAVERMLCFFKPSVQDGKDCSTLRCGMKGLAKEFGTRSQVVKQLTGKLAVKGHYT